MTIIEITKFGVPSRTNLSATRKIGKNDHQRLLGQTKSKQRMKDNAADGRDAKNKRLVATILI